MIDTLAKEIINIHTYNTNLYSSTEEQVEQLIASYNRILLKAIAETPDHTLRYSNLVLSKTRLTTALFNPIHKIVLYRKCQELLQMNSLQEIL